MHNESLVRYRDSTSSLRTFVLISVVFAHPSQDFQPSKTSKLSGHETCKHMRVMPSRRLLAAMSLHLQIVFSGCLADISTSLDSSNAEGFENFFRLSNDEPYSTTFKCNGNDGLDCRLSVEFLKTEIEWANGQCPQSRCGEEGLELSLDSTTADVTFVMPGGEYQIF